VAEADQDHGRVAVAVRLPFAALVRRWSKRLYVMHRSRMAAELVGADINEPAVLAHFLREQHADLELSEVLAVAAHFPVTTTVQRYCP
jgi:hypothetical protein